MSLVTGLLLLAVLLLIGLSVPVALGATALVSMMTLGTRFTQFVPSQIFGQLDNWVLLAVVFFVFYGRLAAELNVRERLAGTLTALFGGSATAALAAEIIAGLFQPDASGEALLQRNDDAAAMTNRLQQSGVPPWKAIGVAGALACLRLLMPPSVLLIIAAILLQVSIAGVFFAITPVVICAGIVLFLLALLTPGNGHPPSRTQLPAIEPTVLLWTSVPIVFFSGIWAGVFTTSESSAIVIFLALLLGLIEWRLGFREFLRASLDTLQDTGLIVLVLVFGTIIQFGFTLDGSARALATTAVGSLGAWGSLIAAVVALLAAAALLGPLVATFVLLPLAFGVLSAVGFAPNAILLSSCAAITMGLLMPPTGPVFATLVAGSTDSTSRAIAGLSYFSIVVLLVLLYVVLGPLAALT